MRGSCRAGTCWVNPGPLQPRWEGVRAPNPGPSCCSMAGKRRCFPVRGEGDHRPAKYYLFPAFIVVAAGPRPAPERCVRCVFPSAGGVCSVPVCGAERCRPGLALCACAPAVPEGLRARAPLPLPLGTQGRHSWRLPQHQRGSGLQSCPRLAAAAHPPGRAQLYLPSTAASASLSQASSRPCSPAEADLSAGMAQGIELSVWLSVCPQAAELEDKKARLPGQ